MIGEDGAGEEKSQGGSGGRAGGGGRGQPQQVAVVGAGLAGVMTALLLSEHAEFEVTVFEKRPDLRLEEEDDATDADVTETHGRAGSSTKRSINLALSYRGQRALKRVGLLDEVMKTAIRMRARVVHDGTGKNINVQAYGVRPEDAIWSVSRVNLNKVLLNAAEQRSNVRLRFEHRLRSVGKTDGRCVFDIPGGQRSEHTFSLVVGADGAFSEVRTNHLMTNRVSFSRNYVEHGYKELTIPPTPEGDFALPNPEGLHIWPRGRFMLIALPNHDRSFTVTLFAPYHGKDGFDSVDPTNAFSVKTFFSKHFPDVMDVVPNLYQDYLQNPVGALQTVRLDRWHNEPSTSAGAACHVVLVGDAAHAVVPFYGQGMNAAFEDALQLFETLQECNFDIACAVPRFSVERKPAADALADLSLYNYTEMASHTASSAFLLKKRLLNILHAIFPTTFVPLYSMISFSAHPYHRVMAKDAAQNQALAKSIRVASRSFGLALFAKCWPVLAATPFLTRLAGSSASAATAIDATTRVMDTVRCPERLLLGRRVEDNDTEGHALFLLAAAAWSLSVGVIPLIRYAWHTEPVTIPPALV